MRYINIDEALKLPQRYNVMHDALDELFAKRQEEFEKDNPLKQIYKTVPLNQFQKTFGSSTGYKQAFKQTVDYAAYPGFTAGDGFKTTISYKVFNGKIAYTWIALMEMDPGAVADDLKDYQTAWHRQLVEFGMFALTAMFGKTVIDKKSETKLRINSADTVDGDPLNGSKNPVFTNKHTIVRTDDMTDAEFNAKLQSNKFYIDVNLDGTDPLAYAKLADGLYQVKVHMNKLFDDNGQRAGLRGRKKIVSTEDARLSQALASILVAENFSTATGKNTLNMVKNGFDTYETSYLDGAVDQPIPQFATTDKGVARGFLMLDPEYNNQNKGPMMVERVKFKMKMVKTDEPDGVKYLFNQAFDFFCPSWRGIAYIYLGKPAGAAGAWDDPATFTEIKPIAFATPIQVVGQVAMGAPVAGASVNAKTETKNK